MRSFLEVGFIFWGLFGVFALIVVLYLIWMWWEEGKGQGTEPTARSPMDSGEGSDREGGAPGP